jgi:hypothetical protein
MKSIQTLALVAGALGFTTIGLSFPAHAEQVGSNLVNQMAIVTGNNNIVNQTNILVINNRGRSYGSDPYTSKTSQSADIQGDRNRIDQSSDARIDSERHHHKHNNRSGNGHHHHWHH